MKKSDLNHKDKFLLELSKVLMNEERLFGILGSDADYFAVKRDGRGTSVIEIGLVNGAVYDLALKEKK